MTKKTPAKRLARQIQADEGIPYQRALSQAQQQLAQEQEQDSHSGEGTESHPHQKPRTT